MAFLILSLSGLLHAGKAGAEEVDLELVLAMDGSGSISEEEFLLQLQGTAAAFLDPEVQAAIASGPLGKIAVNIIVWADAPLPKPATGWFVLEDLQSTQQLVNVILGFHHVTERKFGIGGGGTGIGEGIYEAIKLIEANDYQGLRKVVDVSGDGVETDIWFIEATLLPEVKQIAKAYSVQVNGLPIITEDEPELDDYYRKNVISGPGAFIVTANGFDDFTRAIRVKLIREIANNVAYIDSENARETAGLLPTNIR